MTERHPAVPLQPVIDPAGWRVEDLGRSTAFTLDDGHLAELDTALARLERTGMPIEAMRRTDFRFDRLAKLLSDVRYQLMDGLGFAQIRNFPIGRYSRWRTAAAYWGLGAYLGKAVMQNALGHMIGHERDLGHDRNDPHHRNYQTNQDTDFHAERCDIVGLLCLQPAKQGGELQIVSSITVYNEMLKRRPDLVAEMIKPLYRDRRGEVPAGKEPWYTLPMFCFQNGYLSVRGGYLFVKSAQRFPEVPRLTDAQREALDLLQAISAECHLAVRLEPGDIQFVHSHVILHARTEYEDWPEPERKRHLLRLWLNTDLGFGDSARPLTAEFAEAVQGVVIPSASPCVPLEADDGTR
jgi:hypothetical protein